VGIQWKPRVLGAALRAPIRPPQASSAVDHPAGEAGAGSSDFASVMSLAKLQAFALILSSNA